MDARYGPRRNRHAGGGREAGLERGKEARHDFTREEFVDDHPGVQGRVRGRHHRPAQENGLLVRLGPPAIHNGRRLHRAVREAFFQLFKDGLIYRGKRLVNWDPVLQTAVADDECFDEEVDAAFYYLPIPSSTPRAVDFGRASPRQAPARRRRAGHVVGAFASRPCRGRQSPARGPRVHRGRDYAPRPLGDTAVAVNPHDPRTKAGTRALRRSAAAVAQSSRSLKMSTWCSPRSMLATTRERADPKAAYATGFLKVTPAHDSNDYDLYQRHKDVMDMFAGGPIRALVNIFAPDATVSDKHGWHDVGSASLFVGKSRDDARTLVIDELREARRLLERTPPYRHSVTHSDRSKAIVEPYLRTRPVVCEGDRPATWRRPRTRPSRRSGESRSVAPLLVARLLRGGSSSLSFDLINHLPSTVLSSGIRRQGPVPTPALPGFHGQDALSASH